jgi:hypothetical protein
MPWEIGLLTTEQFDSLINYLHETGRAGNG